jgi:hypothetical protein
MCRIFLNFDQVAEIESEENLQRFLLSVKEYYDPPNPLFIMEHTNGNRLYFGISPKGCYVSYIDASHEPPYYSSAGDPSSKRTSGYVEYMMSKDNHVTEIRQSKTISFDNLFQVILSFYNTGKRPKNIIEWQLD